MGSSARAMAGVDMQSAVTPSTALTTGSTGTPFMASRRMTVLGGLGVDPPARLSVPGRRALAYLAVAGGTVGRGLMSAQLWPDLSDAQARANLRRALWQLPKGWIVPSGEELVLEAEVDLAEAHRVGRRALEGSRLSLPEVELLSRDLLPGWYDEWVLAEQDAYRLLRVQSLEMACRSLTTAGDLAVAAQAGMLAVTAEPLRESAVVALIDAHLAAGNRYEAVCQYRAFAGRLQAELGLDPGVALMSRLEGIPR